jgi:DNA-binding CsgD family transcriptional regulator
MTLRALDKRDCPHHGHSLFHRSICVSCVREFGVSATRRPKPPIEAIPTWMRAAILGIGGPDPKPTSSRRGSGVRGWQCEMSDLERDVFLSLGWGLGLVEISEKLGITVCSVNNSIVRLQDKMHVGSREQLRVLARKAAREQVEHV